MKNKKFLAFALAAAMTMSMAACGNEPGESSENSSQGTSENSSGSSESGSGSEESGSEDASDSSSQDEADANVVDAELKSLSGKEYGTDYVSLYSKYGKDITIADVTEDEDTGNAYIVKDGVRYELGLDFLSMAMVLNTTVPEGGIWESESDVYANWWKLYIQRWNALLPEIPLYANEYYNMYRSTIKGVEEYPTNPYWDTTKALIQWTSDKPDNSIIIGDVTELSGKFRYATFGASQPGASDLAIQYMIVGLDTVTANKEGDFVWNDTVVASHEDTENADGTKTYTVKIKEGLKFSDGSPVTAKNYVAFTMAFSTPVAAEAAGKDHQSGLTYVGFEDFNSYTGPDSATGSKVFKGIRLLDDYTYSVTVSDKYLPYFYDVTYAGFSAQYLPMWIGDADIKDDGEGVYFTDDFYEKDGDSYKLASLIKATSTNTDDTYPCSGPYYIESFDNADKSAVLKRNPEFPGDFQQAVPSIETVVYKKVVTSTQLEDLKAGGVDVLPNITGGEATNEALALVEAEPDNYVSTHYSRAGYGKLAFRCDFGPSQFPEVRQAVAFCLDRAGFAKDFTGGYGGVQDGPYYSGSWMYQAAVGQGMMLNAYATSVDSAIAVLEEGGWVYDAEGNPYESGVRYKQIPASEISESDITYQSKDGAYVTTKVGDNYYMPLVLNWYGTSDNDFSDLLVTGFVNNENMKNAGFVVQYTFGTFQAMLDEQYQAPVYGLYQGPALYTNFNYATGFTSATYDYSYNLSIDPSMYDNFYNSYFIKDPADAYWLQ